MTHSQEWVFSSVSNIKVYSEVTMALFDFDLDNAVEKPVSARSEERPVRKEKRAVSYEELVHINRELGLEGYTDFDSEKYPYGLVFYDFEVFMYDWLVVLIDPVQKTKTIICNNRSALQEYYDKHSKMIWVGYNNKHYDVPILKGILLGHDPKEISDKLIVEGKKPFEFARDYGLNRIDLISYDVMVKKSDEAPESLKLLEGYMGNDIEETEVDFNLDRPLSREEIAKTMKYCIHDVEQTIEVFRRRIDDFNANISLVETFDLPFEYVSKTKGQLTAIIVDCEKQEHDDEFDIRFVPCIEINKYKYVQEWFTEMCKQHDYSKPLDKNKFAHILQHGEQIIKKNKNKEIVSFRTTVCGIPHIFAWGGVHGAPDEPIHVNGRLFHLDVTSFYPSEMIEYGFLTRNCKSPEKFKQVYDTRVALKKAGKKKEQAPYKIILNSQYGITKDRTSAAFDPVQANNICINGQLLLLDLIEKLERMGEHLRLIQSNTDGLIVWIDNDPKSEAWLKHICNEWIDRTKMGLGFDEIGGVDENGNFTQRIGIVQKDVNNYVFLFSNGKIEVKGKYVKENSDLDNNLPILNEAMVAYITKGIPVEETINNCNEMIKFQSIYRLSSSYKSAWHNGEYLTNKTYRIYASKDKTDTYLGKSAGVGMKVDKFQDTPEHCFILNQSVKDIPMSIKLDRKWYIDMAKKRLEQYGYIMQTGSKLF